MEQNADMALVGEESRENVLLGQNARLNESKIDLCFFDARTLMVVVVDNFMAKCGLLTKFSTKPKPNKKRKLALHCNT